MRERTQKVKKYSAMLRESMTNTNTADHCAVFVSVMAVPGTEAEWKGECNRVAG